MPLDDQLDAFREAYNRTRSEIHKVIVGQEDAVDACLVALICGGHILLEGVPGLGKTRLVKAIASCTSLSFSRIQFTPDLMPADIIGTNIVSEDRGTGSRSFNFSRGPLFAQIVLADEVNRATPKTQAALLEAMQESTVTVSGTRYVLDEPFCVLATQNPLEMEGTYPLPEAQLDRFFFKVVIPFPPIADLRMIIERTTAEAEVDLAPVVDGPTLMDMRTIARQVPIATSVLDLALKLVAGTQHASPDALASIKPYISHGASPRAAQALVLAAKVSAILDGRYNVSRSDIARYARPALRHRIGRTFEADAEGVSADNVVSSLLDWANRGAEMQR